MSTSKREKMCAKRINLRILERFEMRQTCHIDLDQIRGSPLDFQTYDSKVRFSFGIRNQII
jgi:hypothetical protein